MYVLPLLIRTSGVADITDITMRRTRSYTQLARLNALWHSVLPHVPAGMRVGFAFYASAHPVACAMWGRPSARLEDQVTTLELTRLAHSQYVPKNFGSWALARMRAWIRNNMPEIVRVISYQDASVHQGTIYKADNWNMVDDSLARSTWTNRSGRRDCGRAHRVKWERTP